MHYLVRRQGRLRCRDRGRGRRIERWQWAWLAMLSEDGVSTGLLCGTVRVTVTLRVPDVTGSPATGGGTKLPKSCRYSSKLNACIASIAAEPSPAAGAARVC